MFLTLLSHHFFNEKDLQWLKLFSEFELSSEEARALLVVREMGAITNADYRNINCVDTLSASASLRRLRDAGLLESKGKSSQTYYVPGKTIALKEAKASNINPLSTELTPIYNPFIHRVNSVYKLLIYRVKFSYLRSSEKRTLESLGL